MNARFIYNVLALYSHAHMTMHIHLHLTAASPLFKDCFPCLPTVVRGERAKCLRGVSRELRSDLQRLLKVKLPSKHPNSQAKRRGGGTTRAPLSTVGW